VTPMYLVAGGLAVALFVYLVVALLAPEKLG
jgi:K+-transporting ATPase KdpF subunit